MRGFSLELWLTFSWDKTIYNFPCSANYIFNLTSSSANCSCFYIFSAIPSLLFEMAVTRHLQGDGSFFFFSFQVYFLRCISESVRWIFVFLFSPYCFLRCRWQDRIYHLTDKLLLWLPRKDHLFAVLHLAFCGFNHDTSGWLSTYFNDAKRCTDRC